METLAQLTDLMRNSSAADLSLVGRAFAFAQSAHTDHKRYSGEPYFTHLFQTAKTLAELGLDGPVVAAGLLHDTIEDVGVTPEILRTEFGEEVLMLVEGVTNLGHLRYRGIDRYSESMRRLFIASAKDLRVLIVKLADRLHNMRTLSFVPKEKQRRIAIETLEIYAPIAYRLGIRRVSRELQELSFPFVHPDEHARVRTLLAGKESELTKKIEKFHRALQKGLARQNIISVQTSHRIKGLYSLYVKLKNKDWDFEKIYDVLAIRVIVPMVADCYRALGAIHGHWRPLPGRIKDYIAFPKPNGYRSLHTIVFTGDGGVVEIQIRTPEMQHESEFGVAAHFEYKERVRSGTTGGSYLGWAKRMLAALVVWRAKSPAEEPKHEIRVAADELDTPEWVRRLGELYASAEGEQFWTHLRNDFFRNRIFIFTPEGDVVDLPAASSPIDFAYAIHSDIGDHIFGVKVNGKLVAIDTPLKNGDIVQILVRESAHPTAKWLDFVRTTLAKRHIRNALAKVKP